MPPRTPIDACDRKLLLRVVRKAKIRIATKAVLLVLGMGLPEIRNVPVWAASGLRSESTGGYKVKTREPGGEIRYHHSKRWTTNKITVAPSERVGHIRVESITQVVFRSLESWSAIPDTQTLPAPTCARAFQLSRIAPAADRAEIFRREIYAGIRGYAAAYQVRPDPPVQTVPWDDSGRA